VLGAALLRGRGVDVPVAALQISPAWALCLASLFAEAWASGSLYCCGPQVLVRTFVVILARLTWRVLSPAASGKAGREWLLHDPGKLGVRARVKLPPPSGPDSFLLFMHLSHLCPHPAAAAGSGAAELVSGLWWPCRVLEASCFFFCSRASQEGKTFSASMAEWHLVAKEGLS